MLAAVTVWGGVDPARLALSYAYLLSYVVAAGAVSLHFAVTERSYFRAAASAYAVVSLGGVAGVLCCCTPAWTLPLSPFGWLTGLFGQADSSPRRFAIAAAVNFGIGVLMFAVAAVRASRRVGSFDRAPAVGEARRTAATGAEIDADPLGWRETRGLYGIWAAIGSGGFAVRASVLAAACITGATYFIAAMGSVRPPPGDTNADLVAGAVAAVGGWLVSISATFAGLAAAASVAGERSRGTWEPLLMLPGRRSKLLGAKRGAVWRVGRYGVALVALLELFFLLGRLRQSPSKVAPVVWACANLLAAAAVWFAANLGVWMSVRGRSPGAAAAAWASVVAVGVGVTEAAGFGPASAWWGLHDVGELNFDAAIWAAALAGGAWACRRLAVAGLPGRL